MCGDHSFVVVWTYSSWTQSHQSAWRYGLLIPWLSSLSLWILIREIEYRPGSLLSLAKDGGSKLGTALRPSVFYWEKRLWLNLLLIYWCWTLKKTQQEFLRYQNTIYVKNKQNIKLSWYRKYTLSKCKEMQFKTSYHAHPIKLAKTNKRRICIVGEETWNPSPSDILLVGVLMRRKYLDSNLEIWTKCF